MDEAGPTEDSRDAAGEPHEDPIARVTDPNGVMEPGDVGDVRGTASVGGAVEPSDAVDSSGATEPDRIAGVRGTAEPSGAMDPSDAVGVGGIAEPSGAVDPSSAGRVDLVIAALADPTRRQILRLLAEGRPLSASSLASGLPVTRQAVVQHLTILQRAFLVSSERSGREVLFSIQPSALEQTASWMTRLAETWSERLQLLKRIAEAPDHDEKGD